MRKEYLGSKWIYLWENHTEEPERKEESETNKFTWGTRKNAGPSPHRKYCLCSVVFYYHVYSFIGWLLGAE